jgi:hypothetical protein
MSLEIFYEKVAEGLLTNAVRKIHAQDSSEREHFIFRIPVTHARLEGKSQCACSMCVQRETSVRLEKLWRNALLQKIQCCTFYGAGFLSVSLKTELLEVKVTIEFHSQCHKNLISAQCVNCSGRVVTINVMILTSKFPIVVSGSKYT